MAESDDRAAVVQELYRRRESLDPDKRAVVDELAKRMNISQQPEGSATSRFVSNAAEQANPVSLLRGMGESLLHPINAAKAYLAQNTELANRAEAAYKKGDYGQAATHLGNLVLQTIPGLGATSAAAGEQIASGDVAGGLGKSTGAALGVVEAQQLPKVANVAARGLSTASQVIPTAASVATDPAVLRATAKVLPKGEAVLRAVDTIKESIARKKATPIPPPAEIPNLNPNRVPLWKQVGNTVAPPEAPPAGSDYLMPEPAQIPANASPAQLAQFPPQTVIDYLQGQGKPVPEAAEMVPANPNNFPNFKGEPPIQKGMVRLYRGESVKGEASTVPGHSWFSTSPEEAHFHAIDPAISEGTTHRVSYVDIPANDLGKYDASAHPNVGPGEQPYLLPDEIANGRQELFRINKNGDIQSAPKATTTPVKESAKRTTWTGDAKTLSDKMAEWKLTPSEAMGMNQKGWAKLAFDSGVKFPSDAVMKRAIANLKANLAGPERSIPELIERFKSAGLENK